MDTPGPAEAYRIRLEKDRLRKRIMRADPAKRAEENERNRNRTAVDALRLLEQGAEQSPAESPAERPADVFLYFRRKFLQFLKLNSDLKELKMSGTAQKHRNFVAEPMGNKSATELPGIGETLGGRLTEAGFDKAYIVLGQYLVLQKDEELFKEWMKDVCYASSKQSKDCYNCLNDWCKEFL